MCGKHRGSYGQNDSLSVKGQGQDKGEKCLWLRRRYIKTQLRPRAMLYTLQSVVFTIISSLCSAVQRRRDSVVVPLTWVTSYTQWCRCQFWSAGGSAPGKIPKWPFWWFRENFSFLPPRSSEWLFGLLQISAGTFNIKRSGWFDNKYQNARSG